MAQHRPLYRRPVVAVAGVPSNPNLFYFGGVEGGVWKSTDYGLNWANITDGKIPGIADPDRRARGRAVESKRHLRRHRRGRHSRRLRHRRRRLQDDRRRQDVGVRRPARHAHDRQAGRRSRATPTSSMPRRWGTCSSRTPSAASSRRPTAARPGTRFSSSTTTPAASTSRWIRAIRNVLYAAMWQAQRAALEAHQRRPGQRPLQDDRRRRALDEDLDEPGIRDRHPRQDRRFGRGEQPARSSTRSCRRTTAASSAPTTPAPRGSASTPSGSCASAPSTTPPSSSIRRIPTSPTRPTSTRVYKTNDGGKDVDASSTRRTATTTSSGSIRATRRFCSWATTAARPSRSTAATPGAPNTISRPGSSITSRSTISFRSTSSARRKTKAPAKGRARPSAGHRPRRLAPGRAGREHVRRARSRGSVT